MRTLFCLKLGGCALCCWQQFGSECCWRIYFEAGCFGRACSFVRGRFWFWFWCRPFAVDSHGKRSGVEQTHYRWSRGPLRIDSHAPNTAKCFQRICGPGIPAGGCTWLTGMRGSDSQSDVVTSPLRVVDFVHEIKKLKKKVLTADDQTQPRGGNTFF